ncbi:Na_H_Exchanger domain-containing protein [Meloidogyne graminicola]|uniref:Na_H_Exchanger domain-containing protein n=1 Tax=Meloidogyne graminicola TaxID=189291 RepID=A0A8T0A2A0_9BILA|nr:Na_H_Exchanger domain-containing protein [Meloidogyne graminicola]
MVSSYAQSITSISATRLGVQLHKMFINIINHREINFVITSLLIFIALYASLTAIFGTSLIHPLTNNQNESIEVLPSLQLTPQLSNLTLEQENFPQIIKNFKIFLFSSPIHQCQQFNSQVLILPNEYNGGNLIVEIAFLLVIIRGMLEINFSSLKNNLVLTCLLAILCPLIECITIILAATLLFKINLPIAILFGFTMSASSPPVIVPTIKQLKEKHFNNDGIVTVILLSTLLDNIFALACFGIAFEAITTKYEQLSYTLSRIPGEILIGAIIGISAGFLLRFFPRPDAHLVHFMRVLILSSIGIAFHFGARKIGCVIAGPMAVLIMTGVASIHWQLDNRRGFSSTKLFDAVLFLLLSLLVRFVTGLICTFCCSTSQIRSPSERLFISLAVLPKGSLQLIIAPAILCFYIKLKEINEDGIFLSYETILLSILFSAPIGEMLLRLLGPLLLRRKLIPNACVVPLGESYKKGGLVVAHSDPWDNKLRLELGPIDPVDPRPHQNTAYQMETTNKIDNDPKM